MVNDKLQGLEFEAALARNTKPNSHFSLGNCNRAMRGILADLGLDSKEVQEDITTYLKVRDRIVDLSKDLFAKH